MQDIWFAFHRQHILEEMVFPDMLKHDCSSLPPATSGHVMTGYAVSYISMRRAHHRVSCDCYIDVCSLERVACNDWVCCQLHIMRTAHHRVSCDCYIDVCSSESEACNDWVCCQLHIMRRAHHRVSCDCYIDVCSLERVACNDWVCCQLHIDEKSTPQGFL